MTNIRIKRNLITAVFVFFYIAAALMWHIDDLTMESYNISLVPIEAVIYVLLLIGWMYSLRTRLLQGGLRRYLVSMAAMLCLWFILRGLKYYYARPNTDLFRYLWYLYYLPMLFFPVFALMATDFIGQDENYIHPKKTHRLYLVSLILLLFVLTNDVHQLVFSFPDNGLVFSDAEYRHGGIYYLIMGWFLSISITVFIQLFRKCRLPQKNRLILGPIIPFFLGLIYHFAYITGHVSFFPDMIAVLSICSVLTFELAIRTGVIRSNSFYTEYFQQSSVPAQILNDALQPQYVSDKSVPYDRDLLETVIAQRHILQGTNQISASPIKGGYVIWQEDVSELIHVKEALESANEYLEDQNTALNRSYMTGVKRKRLEEQNRLYNAMQNETADILEILSEHISCFEQTEGEVSHEYLRSIGIICAYLKRRNNLIFLAEESRSFPVRELYNCINESAKMLQSFGITCNVQMDVQGRLSLEQMIDLYDMFEEVIEITSAEHPHYYISLKDGTTDTLRIRIAGLNKLPEFSFHPQLAEEEDESEWLLEVHAEEVSS